MIWLDSNMRQDFLCRRKRSGSYTRLDNEGHLPTPPKEAAVSNKEIGARLRALRRVRGLKQVELAQLLGTHQTSISQIESGSRGLSLHQVIKVSRALKTSLDDLLGDKKANREVEQQISGRLLRRLRKIEDLPEVERRVVLKMIDGLIEQHSRGNGRR